MIKHIKSVIRHRLFRFGLIGVWNTIFDFIVFNILLTVTAGSFLGSARPYVCNIISASLAAVLSFELNKRFVFQPTAEPPKYYRVYFVLIVLSGIFILQNAVIFVVEHFGGGVASFASTILENIGISLDKVVVQHNLAKILATSLTMIWNFVLFNKVIFKNKS